MDNWATQWVSGPLPPGPGVKGNGWAIPSLKFDVAKPLPLGLDLV